MKNQKPKVIILDDNALSLSLYAEEFPENFKEITELIKKANNQLGRDKKELCRIEEEASDAIKEIIHGKVEK